MTPETLTARQLVELGIPSLPKERVNVTRKASIENWPYRQSGQTREFIVLQIPNEKVRAEIIRYFTTDAPLAQMPAPSEDKRYLARAIIVTEFQAHCRQHGLKLTAAEPGFISLYNAQQATGADAPFPRWLFDVYPSFSIASLRLWRAKATSEDPAALKDSYGNRKGQSVLALANGGAVASAIVALMCDRQLMAAGRIRDMIRIDFGTELQLDGRTVPLPKIRAFERFIDNWKKENPSLYERATNPDSWRSKYMLALGNASADIVRLNQRWEIDASPMDVKCADGRYLVYALVDIYSRRMMLHVSRTAKTEGSLALVRRAILAWGVPEEIRTDNGSDFKSDRFMSALPQVGIRQIVSGPFQPWKKAFVERAIKTFQHGFAPSMPGFIGHSVADRQKLRASQSFADSLGSTEEDRFEVMMTHNELQTHIDNWVEGYYHQQPHSGLNGETPFARASRSMEKPRMVQNIRALDVLLAPVGGVRSIRKQGISVEGAHFWNDTLGLYMGKEVFVRHDADDMGRIYVFDLENKFICEATNIDRLGADRATVATTAKALQKKELSEQYANIRKEIKKNYSPGKVAEKLARDHARAASRVAAFPRPTETYTTPSLDEAARAVTKEAIPAERTEDQKAKQEAFVERCRQRDEAKAAKAAATSWKERCSTIEAALASGEPLSESDAKWYGHIQTTPPYIAWKRFEKLRRAQVEGM